MARFCWSTLPAVLVLSACISLPACISAGGYSSDAGQDSGDGGTAVCPPGYAAVTFFVDDTQNKTYLSGELVWTGTLRYDPRTNIITHDPNWNQALRTFPPLADDGPIAAGGHEMPGAAPGDHILSTEVFVLADRERDLEFHYGLTDSDGLWRFDGPLGTFTLPARYQGRLDVPGVFVHAFGSIDLRLELDSRRLPPAWTFDAAKDQVGIRGSMIGWRQLELFDNGQAGDLVAGDGVYTYQHSEHLGRHEGLLWAGQRIQFVFTIGGVDYLAGEALPTGIEALSTCTGAFQGEAVFMEQDSLRTRLTPTLDLCSSGSVAIGRVSPTDVLSFGGTLLSIFGEGFAEGTAVSLSGRPATEVRIVDSRQINCLTPPLEPGTVTLRVTLPNGSFGQVADAIRAVAAPPLSLLAVEPDRGPTAGGGQVALSGRGFVPGAQVTFGGVPAEGVAFHAAERLTCKVPPGSTGRAAVTVQNPDGSVASLPLAFEYSDAPDTEVDFAALLPPVFAMAQASQPVSVAAVAFEAPLSPGCDGRLQAEFGFGPSGSDPSTTAEQWRWIPAVCDGSSTDVSSPFDRFSARAVFEPGVYTFAFRTTRSGGPPFTLADAFGGSADGYDPRLSGTLVVTPGPGVLRVDAVAPDAVPVRGGTLVTLRGAGFDPSLSAALDGVPLPVEVRGPGELRFTPGPHPAGPSSLRLLNPGAEPLLMQNALLFTLLGRPTVDGELGLGTEWPLESRLAENTVPSDLGPNALHELFAAYDSAGLYLALRGFVDAEAAFAAVVYLDVDFGTGTGLQDMRRLTDRTGAQGEAGFDDAISSLCQVRVPGFGADFAVGTQGMANVGLDESSPAALSRAGLRSLEDRHELGWRKAAIVTRSSGGGQIEMFLPWSSLYGGNPPAGVRLALFARLLSRDGETAGNACLPPDDPAHPERISHVAAIDLRL